MEDKTGMTQEQLDRYSDRIWTGLVAEAQKVEQEYRRGGHNDVELHGLADRLREITGGAGIALRVIPLVAAEHRKAVMWGVERLLVATQTLQNRPYVRPEEAEAVERQVTATMMAIDAGRLDEAEAQTRELEEKVERLEMASLEAECEALLTGLAGLYEPAI